jgi:hypothetical protein
MRLCGYDLRQSGRVIRNETGSAENTPPIQQPLSSARCRSDISTQSDFNGPVDHSALPQTLSQLSQLPMMRAITFQHEIVYGN